MSPTAGRLTVEEYLARERVSVHRSEMADGQTRLMPGNSRAHNLIVGTSREASSARTANQRARRLRCREVVDRRKLGLYGRLPSVREFILVSQEKARAEQYVRDGEGWIVRFVEGPDAALHLAAVGCIISLGMVYAGVEFPPCFPLDPVTLRL